MITFSIHVPMYCDISDEARRKLTKTFTHPEEILQDELVQPFKGDSFTRFSQIKEGHVTTLMAEYNEGEKWVVVGHAYELTHADEANKHYTYKQVDFKLEEWQPKYPPPVREH